MKIYLSNFKIISAVYDWCISCEIALKWISLDLADDKSALVQVMAWCRQATSHYPGQCWPSFMSPYGFTMRRCVKQHLCRVAVHKTLLLRIQFGLATPNSVIGRAHHIFKPLLVLCSTSSRCCLIVNCILRNKLPWNLNQNSDVFIQENLFIYVVCKSPAILFRFGDVEDTENPSTCSWPG